jgi:hypothetical protein
VISNREINGSYWRTTWMTLATWSKLLVRLAVRRKPTDFNIRITLTEIAEEKRDH